MEGILANEETQIKQHDLLPFGGRIVSDARRHNIAAIFIDSTGEVAQAQQDCDKGDAIQKREAQATILKRVPNICVTDNTAWLYTLKNTRAAPNPRNQNNSFWKWKAKEHPDHDALPSTSENNAADDLTRGVIPTAERIINTIQHATETPTKECGSNLIANFDHRSAKQNAWRVCPSQYRSLFLASVHFLRCRLLFVGPNAVDQIVKIKRKKNMADETGCRLYLLWFVRFMKGLTILSLLATIAAYVIIIKYGVTANSLSNSDKAFSVLGNAGFIVLAIVLIIAEFEPDWFIRKVMLMHYWAGRGTWVLWMGVETISASKQLYAAVQADPSVNAGLLENFGTAVGSTMIACGGIYIIFTFLCVKAFTDLPELDQPLMGQGGVDQADAILAANLALALGMTPADAKKRFSKSDGAKEAQKLAAARAEELKNLQGKLAKMGSNTARGVASEASKTFTAAADTTASTASSYAPPPSNNARANDDDTGGRRKTDDEDELMRAYYGAGKGN